MAVMSPRAMQAWMAQMLQQGGGGRPQGAPGAGGAPGGAIPMGGTPGINPNAPSPYGGRGGIPPGVGNPPGGPPGGLPGGLPGGPASTRGPIGGPMMPGMESMRPPSPTPPPGIGPTMPPPGGVGPSIGGPPGPGGPPPGAGPSLPAAAGPRPGSAIGAATTAGAIPPPQPGGVRPDAAAIGAINPSVFQEQQGLMNKQRAQADWLQGGAGIRDQGTSTPGKYGVYVGANPLSHATKAFARGKGMKDAKKLTEEEKKQIEELRGFRKKTGQAVRKAYGMDPEMAVKTGGPQGPGITDPTRMPPQPYGGRGRFI